MSTPLMAFPWLSVTLVFRSTFYEETVLGNVNGSSVKCQFLRKIKLKTLLQRLTHPESTNLFGHCEVNVSVEAAGRDGDVNLLAEMV